MLTQVFAADCTAAAAAAAAAVAVAVAVAAELRTDVKPAPPALPLATTQQQLKTKNY
jgi:hypothetical protein